MGDVLTHAGQILKGLLVAHGDGVVVLGQRQDQALGGQLGLGDHVQALAHAHQHQINALGVLAGEEQVQLLTGAAGGGDDPFDLDAQLLLQLLGLEVFGTAVFAVLGREDAHGHNLVGDGGGAGLGVDHVGQGGACEHGQAQYQSKQSLHVVGSPFSFLHSAADIRRAVDGPIINENGGTRQRTNRRKAYAHHGITSDVRRPMKCAFIGKWPFCRSSRLCAGTGRALQNCPFLIKYIP